MPSCHRVFVVLWSHRALDSIKITKLGSRTRKNIRFARTVQARALQHSTKKPRRYFNAEANVAFRTIEEGLVDGICCVLL